jgi:hypothetical protein
MAMSGPALTVVWDGRRSGPGGAYLGLDEHETAPPPPTTPRRESNRELRARVLASLRKAPKTMLELADDVGASMERVNGVLWSLRQTHAVVVVGERPRADVRYGRRIENVYGADE